MAVRKLKSGKWAADVTVGVKWDGSRDRRVETYPTKGQARKAETRLLMEKERLRGRVTARITLAEFVDEVYWPQKAGLRANTRQGYERDLRRRILPALGNMELEQINKLNIQREARRPQGGGRRHGRCGAVKPTSLYNYVAFYWQVFIIYRRREERCPRNRKSGTCSSA